MNIFKSLFGSRNERVIKAYLPLVAAVNSYEPEYERLSDDALRAKTAEFKKRLEKGASLDDLLPEAFAVAREAAKRVLGQRLYDVQVMGGIALHRRSIAEMITGEGKTLTSVAPAYLNALTGRGVHAITVNDYLARRDAAWNRPIFAALDMTVGCIQSRMMSAERIPEYAADITYGTNSEFGFDYLRDNMKTRVEDQCQRDRYFAIIDEVDSILIDEARTPLIISGPSDEATENYYLADRVVRRWKQQNKGVEKAELDERVLKEARAPGPERERLRLEIENDYLYVYAEKSKAAYLTERGIVAAQNELGISNFYAPEVMNQNWPHHLEQAVRAHVLYEIEVEYVVREGEIIIVDQYTGRMMEGRRWSDGLHQAIEAKESIKIREEFQTLATVTIQNFFRQYDKLSGMTGTALTEAAEFHKIYELDVLSIPTNRPLRRDSHEDRIFLSEKEKYDAILGEIKDQHRVGRPVLVGTTSIELSERLSRMLVRHGVPHEVLNAKHHEREAAIVAKAGQLGSVTIATNMAGRGTDILLGRFEHAELLEHWENNGLAPKGLRVDAPDLRSRLLSYWSDVFVDPESKAAKKAAGGGDAAQLAALQEAWRDQRLPDLPLVPVTSVADIGGLHIVGTERHESRRIDNQLRGRAGRQGDPGSSIFYVSLEDPLMRRFARDGVKKILAKLGMGEGQDITSPWVSKSIQRAQKKTEEYNFDIRKNLLEYDKVNDEQRRAIYERRTMILRGEELEETTWEMIDMLLATVVAEHIDPRKAPDEWEVAEITGWVRRKFGIGMTSDELRTTGSQEGAQALVRGRIAAAIDEAKEEMGADTFGRTLRFLLLNAFDDKWKDHIRELDSLRTGIGLRGYAQRDPKLEYKREASEMFAEMQQFIAEQVSDGVLRFRLTEEMDDILSGRWQPKEAVHEDVESFDAQDDAYGNMGATPERIEPIRREEPKVGRNDPCPCGSGKKYKKCCGRAS